MAEHNDSCRRSGAGEAFALIRDAFVQGGRVLGRAGGSERQLSLHSADGRLELVISHHGSRHVGDEAKFSSSAASDIASALVQAHSVCKTASVIADVEVRVRPPAMLLQRSVLSAWIDSSFQQGQSLPLMQISRSQPLGWDSDHRESGIDLAHDSNPSTPSASREAISSWKHHRRTSA